jgi:hypothetical protein
MLCPNGTVKPFLVSLVEPVAYLKSELAAVRSRISLACSRISPAKALFRLASKFGFVPALPFRPVHITDTEKNGFPLFICCFSAQVFLDKSDHVYSQIFAFCLRFHLLIRGRTRRGPAVSQTSECHSM